MIDDPVTTLLDIEALHENFEIECKLAQGRDGNGALPESIWETYSAFANTMGGVIFLGVREEKGQFTIEGIPEPMRVIESILEGLDNKDKVSVNLLGDSDLRIEQVEGKSVIILCVPKASYKHRPVYINGDVYQGSYHRNDEADERCPALLVKQMLAEREED